MAVMVVEMVAEEAVIGVATLPAAMAADLATQRLHPGTGVVVSDHLVASGEGMVEEEVAGMGGVEEAGRTRMTTGRLFLTLSRQRLRVFGGKRGQGVPVLSPHLSSITDVPLLHLHRHV